MKTRHIIITAPDFAKLQRMIQCGELSTRERAEAESLQAELDRAEIVEPEDVPADVITMNSRARLLDLDTGEEMEFTLVFPEHADASENKISVLAPIGTGMLGYRIGDIFERRVPYGMLRLEVVEVAFQPERVAALAEQLA